MKSNFPACIALLAMVGCSQRVAEPPPQLPPLTLRPMLAEFRAMADKVPVDPLEKEVRHTDPVIRRDAATQLADIGHPSAIPALLHALKDEKDTSVRLHFAQALARLGNLSAIPELIAGMQVGEFARKAGLLGMRILEDHFRSPGESPTYQLLGEELATLHRLWQRRGRAPRAGDATLDEKTKARLARHFVNLEGFQLRPVDEARFVLSRVGVAAVPLLELALQAEETYLREHAMEVLRAVGAPGRAATRHVLPLLQDPLFRAAAAQTLGELGDENAAPHLLRLLDDADLEVRCAAAGALGPLGSQSATKALGDLLANEKEPMDLRVRAAFSLALLEPKGNGLPFLLERLDAEDYHRPTLEELIERVGR